MDEGLNRRWIDTYANDRAVRLSGAGESPDSILRGAMVLIRLKICEEEPQPLMIVGGH